MTPVHWKKEEARVIKLSDYEKIEAERKEKQEKKKADMHSKEKLTESTNDDNINDTNEQNKEVDYNALDYEDNENQSDYEQEIAHKQVSSLVQYPLPGSYQPVESKQNEALMSGVEAAQNKRSEALAMALGVQIKTGEDPVTGEIKISGYDKKNKTNDTNNSYISDRNTENDDRGKTSKVVAPSAVHKVSLELAENYSKNKDDNKRNERNKFETEKPNHTGNDAYRNGRYRQMDYKRNDRDYRRDDYRRPLRNRPYSYRGNERYLYIIYNKILSDFIFVFCPNTPCTAIKNCTMLYTMQKT